KFETTRLARLGTMGARGPMRHPVRPSRGQIVSVRDTQAGIGSLLDEAFALEQPPASRQGQRFERSSEFSRVEGTADYGDAPERDDAPTVLTTLRHGSALTNGSTLTSSTVIAQVSLTHAPLAPPMPAMPPGLSELREGALFSDQYVVERV